MDHIAKQTSLVFFGTPVFAAKQLENLLVHGYQVKAVVTAPDKPAGRGLRMRSSEVKQVAQQNDIPILQPANLREPDFLSQLKAIDAKLFVVIAFRMLPPEVWKMPALGTFNLHASLLPNYRGAAPINWAIINGETETGLTTFFLNEKIDEGKIILQQKMPILPDETASELHDRMIGASWPLLEKTIELISTGRVEPVEQNHQLALRQAPKISRAHMRIQWNQPLINIRNHIRGLSLDPGAYTLVEHKSGKRFELRILKAGIIEPLTQIEPLKLFVINKKLMISHNDGWLNIEKLQPEGKNLLNAAEFVNGFRDDGGWVVI